MYQLSFAFVFSIFVLVLLQEGGKTNGQPFIEDQHGSLYMRVERSAKNQLREGSNTFTVPTRKEQAAWVEAVQSVLDGRLAHANKIIKTELIPYRLIRFTDNSTNRKYFLLEEKPIKKGWGLYLFDLDTKNTLVIEVPHPVSDKNTELVGIDGFLETHAAAFLMAGTHRRANKNLSVCTQATSNSKYAESDVAHSTQTMFHRTHEVLFVKRPDTVAVQIHGMRSREICPNVFLSSGTKNVTTNSRNLLNCLLKEGVESGIFDGETSTCPLIARTNVQGRFSNGLKHEACNMYAKTSPEPGHFIHVEQEPEIRKNKKTWRPVIESLKCAFPDR